MLLAILGGGDWADASVDHLVASDGFDVKAAYDEYKTWYKTEYCSAYIASSPANRPQYFSFEGWLLENAACRPAEDDEITVFDMDQGLFLLMFESPLPPLKGT